MEMTPELLQRIQLLEAKFSAMGQDLNSYLDGLLYADYLTYWDYIHLDTLLSLQNPKTSFKDEKIFIMYHQITELYFKLSLHELEQIADNKLLDAKFFIDRLNRVNRYFEALTHSFEIMVDGMEQAQFLKFRMSLLPASGFQSGQYRMIEICATDFINLVAKDKRPEMADVSIENMFEHIYWKTGATELATGKKTLTLIQFEEKYAATFIQLAQKMKDCNVLQSFEKIDGYNNADAIIAMKQMDINVNINWPLMHYKSAARYLQKNPEDIAATGGTNWQKYLPPRFQKRIFYPKIWTADEHENWGKAWVESLLKK